MMDECGTRVMFGDDIACRHSSVDGRGPANLVSVRHCTGCHWSKVPCENPRPMPTQEQVDTPIVKPPTPAPAPQCIHKQNETGELVSCVKGTCRQKVFVCDVHDFCTTGENAAAIKSCVSCDDDTRKAAS